MEEFYRGLSEKYPNLPTLLLMLFVLIAIFLFLRSNEKSRFKLKESERMKGKFRDSKLGSAKYEKKEPLQITGIRIDAPPHEILGIALNATREQINQAFKEKMKQYHPDKIGPPGSQGWTDAQEIATALNKARDEMLARAKV